MKIESKQDLKEIIQLLRKLGVQSARIDGVELHMGELPRPTPRKAKIKSVQAESTAQFTPGGIDENTRIVSEIADIDTDELTDEQLLFYSAVPESGEQQEQAQ